MIRKFDCRQIATVMQVIRVKKADFDVLQRGNNIAASVKLMNELKSTIEEAIDRVWPLEILTEENIEKQYDEWNEMYADLNSEYKLPTKERLFEFLKKDPGFLELMKTKEKQGLTKLIIAPAPGFYHLKSIVEQIGNKMRECGGEMDNDHYPGIWSSLITREDIHYFGTIGESLIGTIKVPIDGTTESEIKSRHDEFSICDGWMISFTTDEQNLARIEQPEIYTGGGRKAIAMGRTAEDYIDMYFSDNDKEYIGEEPMIPHEYFACFAKDLYEKYIKSGKKITDQSSDLIDSDSITSFISTYWVESPRLPCARLYTPLKKVFLLDNYCDGASLDVGVRAVVRRKIKS